MDSHPSQYVTVGVEESAEALTAARFAAAEAERRAGCGLRIAHAYRVPPTDLPHSNEELMGFADQAETMINKLVAHLDLPSAIHVVTLLKRGFPADLLRPTASDSALIVLGHQRVRAGSPSRMGGLVNQLGSDASCPIAVVPRHWEPSERQGMPVVVALDGETAAQDVMRFAFDEASTRRSELIFLHATARQGLYDRERRSRINIAEVIAGWRAEYPEVTAWTKFDRADATELIIETSARAAIMIIGQPHRHGPAAWRRSLACQVIESSDCPLVVVPNRPPDLAARRFPAAEVCDGD